MKVILKLHYPYNPEPIVFEDVIEVHYNYKTFEPRVAIEQKETGQTYAIRHVKEFEVFE